MSHATHPNAALTPRARLRLGRLVVEHGWPIARAAERYDVSWRTAAKWARRYALDPLGHQGLANYRRYAPVTGLGVRTGRAAPAW